MANDSDLTWKKLGEKDPYFGVITHSKFLNANLNEEALRDFFLSGEEHVEHIYEYINSKVCASFHADRVLDYGCGVGRLVIPFSKRCQTAVGVDIAPGMLEQARWNCERLSVTNVQFMYPDDLYTLAPGSFDLVHSYIVFQHIPVSRGEQILNNLIRLIAEGGIGAIHLTYSDSRSLLHNTVATIRRYSSLAHGLLNVIQGVPFSRPLMQMNRYSINRILDMLLRAGCSNVHIEFSSHSGFNGVMLYFEKTPRPFL
jgi:ubiquinone/menaquinone biosynthesis C-methylase UbiE